MILIILGMSFLLAVIGQTIRHRASTSNAENTGTTMLVFGIISFVISVIISLSLTFISIDDNSAIVAYQQNIPIMKATAEKLNEIAVVKTDKNDKALISGIENMQQSTNVSGMWVKYQGAMVEYNKKIAWRKVMRSSVWFYGILVPLPDGAVPISFEKE